MPRTTLVSLGGSRAWRSLAVALVLGGLALPSSAQTPTREQGNLHSVQNLIAPIVDRLTDYVATESVAP